MCIYEMGIKKIITLLIFSYFTTFTYAKNGLISYNKEWWGNINLEYLEKILNDGFDPNSKDTEGYTLLHYASFSKSPKIIEVLIYNGADINSQKNTFAQSPLHWAAHFGSKKHIKILINLGADINAKDSLDRTTCYYLKRNNNLSQKFIKCYC